MQLLVVTRMSDHWTIHADGKPWGRFVYRVDAEEAALRLAARAARQGREVEVLVRSLTGQTTALKVA